MCRREDLSLSRYSNLGKHFAIGFQEKTRRTLGSCASSTIEYLHGLMAVSRAALKDPEHRTNMVHKNSYFNKLTLTLLNVCPRAGRMEPGAVAENGSSWERSCIVKSGKLRYRVVGRFLGKWDELDPPRPVNLSPGAINRGTPETGC